MSSIIRIAVVQAGSVMFDTAKTLERMQVFCERAAASQASLMVFPEAYIGGYPKGLDFGARMGTRSEEGRDDYLRYWKGAIDVPGPETARIGEFAAASRSTLVVGVIERLGATLYCSALLFGPDGRLQARHRKLMPTASERLVWGCGDGSTMQVVDTAVGKVAAAICWENYMPLFRASLYAQGVQFWCAPTVDDRDVWQCTMRHIAVEGRCFVLSACQYFDRSHCPDNYSYPKDHDPKAALIRGGSVVVSPFGEVLAGPVYDQECVLSAEINLDDITRGKYDLDVAGHYARPDVFQLHVNRAAVIALGPPRSPSDGEVS
jgi:nitrilase